MIDTLNYHRSEAALYSRFIKYEKLNVLLAQSLKPGYKEINIFIDMTQMLSSMYRFEDISNPLGLLATMINLPLHYRNYFNRLKVKSNIFLIYSSNNIANNYRFIASYDHKHKMRKESNSMVHSVIENNISLMDTTVKYMPGIYLKRGTVEPTVIAADLIDRFTRQGMDVPHIFISSTDYAFQLPSIMGNVILLYKASERMDKKMVDGSFAVIHANALYAYIRKTKNKDLSLQYQDTPLNQSWVSAFMVLTGLACRTVKSICSYQQAISILKFIEGNYNVITPDSIYNALVDTSTKPVIVSREEIHNRFCAIDLDYQLKLYREMPESLEFSFLVDLDDPQALHDINNKFFNRANVLELQRL
jgi:hypothetical protein